MTLNNENSSKETPYARSLILSIVRGEVPLYFLRQIGIKITSADGSYTLRSNNFDVAVAPAAEDIAKGLLRYASGDKNDLREWAFFLLAESGALDLSAVELHPQGDSLLSALWDASFEGCVSGATIELAQNLTTF